jgi:hypothetical protein
MNKIIEILWSSRSTLAGHRQGLVESLEYLKAK